MTLLGLMAYVLLNRHSNILNSVSMEKAPEVLTEIARNIQRDAGYTDPPIDRAFGFLSAGKYLDYVERKEALPAPPAEKVLIRRSCWSERCFLDRF